MGTKNNPGTYDCYENTDPDEPMFILLARDPLAPALVREWAQRRAETRGRPDAKIDEARACAENMERWFGGLCGSPDPAPTPILASEDIAT
jgi:hypothetical protein